MSWTENLHRLLYTHKRLCNKLHSQHSPVFDSEGHSPDVWLSIEAGEVDGDLVVANDDVGVVVGHDGVLVDDLAVVDL